MNNVKIIAFYLPQFHPIPENDDWWGPGFTEWTNVAKAKPLFRNHWQPRLPADLGFYDLRVAETREQQARMARENGIYGFAYWHYWFAGKRILERPFKEVLSGGNPDFPFCLAWANETWSGIWHGNPKRILIEQTYPGKADYEAHFNSLLDAFQDPRYIKINNKPLYILYKPNNVPDIELLFDLWNNMAIKEGFSGIHFVGVSNNISADFAQLLNKGFDAVIPNRTAQLINWKYNYFKRVYRKISGHPYIISYKEAIKKLYGEEEKHERCYPTILPNWDNSPRSGKRALVLTNSTPEVFKEHLEQILDIVKSKSEDNKIIFLKSWNEWAEGNYVEPDTKFGKEYLKIIKSVIKH